MTYFLKKALGAIYYFYMKIIFATILLAMITLVSCKKADYDVNEQNKAFESFLDSREYSYTVPGGVYRSIYVPGTGEALASGDSVYINYIGYIFSSGLGTVFTTNLEAEAVKAGLDPAFLKFTPKGLRLGDNSLLKGIDLGLVGRVEGDSLLLLINSDLAYGNKAIGTVPEGSPLAFNIVIKKIVK